MSRCVGVLGEFWTHLVDKDCYIVGFRELTVGCVKLHSSVCSRKSLCNRQT